MNWGGGGWGGGQIDPQPRKTTLKDPSIMRVKNDFDIMKH